MVERMLVDKMQRPQNIKYYKVRVHGRRGDLTLESVAHVPLPEWWLAKGYCSFGL